MCTTACTVVHLEEKGTKQLAYDCRINVLTHIKHKSQTLGNFNY